MQPVVERIEKSAPLDDDAQLALVRALLTGDVHGEVARNRQRIEKLESLLGDGEKVADSIAASLPEAISLAYSPQNRNALESALAKPWLGAARHVSEHQLNAATQALAPMMLPAIGHAVRERMASFSIAMQRASPMRRIAWKIRSLQTGLPLETVIEQDLDPFRVHRILAIEMPAGNLLAAHRVTDKDASKSALTAADEEDESYATAALLTALRGFVRDAGIGAASGELSSVAVGQRTIHVAQQGAIMIAVEASGHLAYDLEGAVHSELIPALRKADTQSERERILSTWRESRIVEHGNEQKLNTTLILFIIGLLFAIGWLGLRMLENHDVSRTVERLLNTPGVASAHAIRTSEGWRINVAADPLAKLDPALQPTQILRKKLDVRVDKVLALDQTMIARAIELNIPPPAGVGLEVTHDAVRISGQVSDAYVDAVRSQPRVVLAGLRIDTSAAQVVRP